MPYDKDGKYFRKPVVKTADEIKKERLKQADEIKKERFKQELKNMKNYKGSESYQKMMSKYKGSISGYKKLDIKKWIITFIFFLVYILAIIVLRTYIAPSSFVIIGLIIICVNYLDHL